MILYESKDKCCGCGACQNVCPKHAISLEEDEFGYVYPRINETLCINCHLCRNVCLYQNEVPLNFPIQTYAAASKSEITIQNSASGGLFAAIAEFVIKQGGVVAGCVMKCVEGKLFVQHTVCTKLEDLVEMQGSKYVQSDCGDIYKRIKGYLDEDRLVLFSGTPCQIAALKTFLRGKEYPKLVTADIICHGVPNQKMFHGFLDCLERDLKKKIIRFKFRDKSAGWGLRSGVFYSQNSVLAKINITAGELSFYKLFLDSEIYRDNCYTCPFAKRERVSDITLGDYWGVEIEHPEILSVKGGKIDSNSGCSCVLVNSEKGKAVIDSIHNDIALYDTTFEKIAAHNEQLVRPSTIGKNRKEILMLFSQGEYTAVEKWFSNKKGLKYKLKRLRMRLTV